MDREDITMALENEQRTMGAAPGNENENSPAAPCEASRASPISDAAQILAGEPESEESDERQQESSVFGSCGALGDQGASPAEGLHRQVTVASNGHGSSMVADDSSSLLGFGDSAMSPSPAAPQSPNSGVLQDQAMQN